MKTPVFLVYILFLSEAVVFGQSTSETLSNYQLQIQSATTPITLDGVLDEQAWLEADVADKFWMQQPIDGKKANPRTKVRMTYDSDNVYIAAICYDVQDYVV